MKTLFYVALLALITGCSTTVPVVAKFPEVPATLLEKCPELGKLKDESKLSDVAKTVSLNYVLYNECAVKHDAFVEWYFVQKKLFETVK